MLHCKAFHLNHLFLFFVTLASSLFSNNLLSPFNLSSYLFLVSDVLFYSYNFTVRLLSFKPLFFFSNLFDLPFFPFSKFSFSLFQWLLTTKKNKSPAFVYLCLPLTDFSFCSTSFLCCLHPRLFYLTSHFTLSIILQVAYSHFTKPIFRIF